MLIYDGYILPSVYTTLQQSNIAMENGPFEDVYPIKNGGFPLLC